MRNTKSKANNFVRLFGIFILCLSFVSSTLVDPRVDAAAPTATTASTTTTGRDAVSHRVHPDSGFVPPAMMEKAALYAQLRSVGLTVDTAAAQTPAAPTPLPGAASQQRAKSHVLIYDARQGIFLPGWRARFESSDPVSDPTVNRAYELHKAMRSFLKKEFKRNSIDNEGMDLIGTVHYGWNYNNAKWTGYQMLYGDGDGIFFATFVLPDIVGHEVFHGITDETCDLDYHGQSGALNEHLSDVFGVLLRQWMQDVPAQKDHWLVGPGLFTGKMNGRALRDMLHPGTAFNDAFFGKDTQAAHMKDFVHTTEDWGGVHSNSGIPNKAFALFAIAVGGKAWKVAGHIWYEVATGGHIDSDCDFQTFAEKTVEVCAKQAPKEVDKLKAAWAAVGITVS